VLELPRETGHQVALKALFALAAATFDRDERNGDKA
jgi:hypothetical protein